MSKNILLAKEQPLKLNDLKKLGGNESILVVDDEKVCRTVATGILERTGYQVEAVDCGQAALDFLIANSTGVDAVILDVTMPGMSGKEVLVEINKLWPDLPVIICSGHPLTPESLHSEIGVSPAAVIQKPYKLELLLRELRQALEQPQKSAQSAIN